MLIEQDFVEIQLLRRSNNWRLESYYLGQTVILESVGAELAVEEIYHKVGNNDMWEWLAAKADQT